MKQLFSKFNLVLAVFIVMGITSVKAQSNQYLDFDGVNDFDSVPNGSAAIANSNAISICGWFYDNLLSYGKGMAGIRGTGGEFYMLELNTGQVEARFKNSAGTLYDVPHVNNTIIPQQWQFFSMVYDGSTVKLYRDSSLVGSINATGMITTTTIPFTIGKSLLTGFNFVYSGRADEVSVWKKAVTLTEIKSMMLHELTGTEPLLQMYYKFNQGVPGGNNTSITMLHSEVNSPTYDAFLNNFALTGSSSNFEGTLNS